MHLDDYLLPSCCAAVLASAVIYFYLRGRDALPLPPGPAPRPVMGNIADIPTDQEWVAYTRMAKEYGALFDGSTKCGLRSYSCPFVPQGRLCIYEYLRSIS